ncbi:hypothetical protein [Oceanobacillus timonensis]|uniref:hypothetical protein n=1 Tax=Oceanobacillus timonensis TaxID=1926285 RepID=UPI0009BAEA97|nr:hypothetical protein [Oceanobacillus timonensis]
MKKHLKIICYSFLLFILLLLIACSDNTNDENNNDTAKDETSENTDTAEDENESQDNTTTDESSINNSDDQPSEESESDTSENNTTEEAKDESPSEKQDTEDNNELSSYSSEEIEYARVWLQLGPNQDIDELYVEHIPAGTPLDPNDDENDVSYPEDVIQISGSRIADGMVTYSGNGDGTINVYDIPYGNRWYGGMPRPNDIDLEEVQEEMRGIIENTESVSIEPGDDEEVRNLIEKIYMID